MKCPEWNIWELWWLLGRCPIVEANNRSAVRSCGFQRGMNNTDSTWNVVCSSIILKWYFWIYLPISVSFFFFFWLHLWHVDVPGRGTEAVSQQQLELLQWYLQILNLTSYERVLISLFYYGEGTPKPYFIPFLSFSTFYGGCCLCQRAGGRTTENSCKWKEKRSCLAILANFMVAQRNGAI